MKQGNPGSVTEIFLQMLYCCCFRQVHTVSAGRTPGLHRKNSSWFLKVSMRAIPVHACPCRPGRESTEPSTGTQTSIMAASQVCGHSEPSLYNFISYITFSNFLQVKSYYGFQLPIYAPFIVRNVQCDTIQHDGGNRLCLQGESHLDGCVRDLSAQRSSRHSGHGWHKRLLIEQGHAHRNKERIRNLVRIHSFCLVKCFIYRFLKLVFPQCLLQPGILSLCQIFHEEFSRYVWHLFFP